MEIKRFYHILAILFMTREELIHLSNTIKTGEDYDKLVAHFSLDRNQLQDKINHACDIISPQKQTILFSTPSRTGTSQFRIWEPMLAIYRLTDDFNLCYTENIEAWHYGVADLILLHRAGDKHDIAHDVFNHWPVHKIKPLVIHNVDDLEFNLSKKHPMYDMWIASGRDKQSIRSIRESHAVEITTHKLKQIMQSHNRNTFITRNQFNWKLPMWNLPKKRPINEFIPEASTTLHDFPAEWNEKVVIGWAGLTSHYEDLAKMAPILKRVHDKYPNTVFILAGMALKDTAYKIIEDPKTGEKRMEEDLNVPEETKYRNRVEKLFKDFAPDRLRIYDALPLEQYGWFNSLFDISLAYIEHNTFNASKSEIKAVEACHYGAIPIFSRFGGYNDFAELLQKEAGIDYNQLNLIACRTEFDLNEWTRNIGYWVEKYGTAEFSETAIKLKAFVDTFYDIDTNTPERVAKYKSMIEQNIEQEQSRILTSGFQPSYQTV